MICPVCSKKIEKEKYKVVALDRPVRINILFHWDCYFTIEDMTTYINENFIRILSENGYNTKEFTKI